MSSQQDHSTTKSKYKTDLTLTGLLMEGLGASCYGSLQRKISLMTFLSSEREMKDRTRDNLIYLAVGLGIAALVVMDVIYSQSHGRIMWVPSSFSSRLVYTTALLAYFVAREARRMKATTIQVLGCVVFGSAVQLVIGFLFRQAFEQLPGISFSVFAVFEMFIVWLLTLQIVRFL